MSLTAPPRRRREPILPEDPVHQAGPPDGNLEVSVAAPPRRREPYLFFDAGTSYHDENYTCPVAWQWTDNDTEAHVIFHNILDNSPTALPDDQPLMLHRAHPEQRYAFFSLESDVNYPVINQLDEFGYDFIIDTRIWGPDGTGGSGGGNKSSGGSGGPIHIPAVYLTNPTAPAFDKDFRRPPQRPKRSDAVLAAFVSNCGSKSGREALLDGLIAEIPVHSYGGCAKNIDEPPEVAGLERLRAKETVAAEYRFLFAAENSISPGYVSEKVYSALAAGAVPVYLGAPDIARFVPHPMSVINAADFDTPAALAAYLVEVAEDDEKYAAYFKWKKEEFTPDFKRVLRLAARTVQCRVAMALEGLDFEADMADLEIFPPPKSTV